MVEASLAAREQEHAKALQQAVQAAVAQAVGKWVCTFLFSGNPIACCLVECWPLFFLCPSCVSVACSVNALRH